MGLECLLRRFVRLPLISGLGDQKELFSAFTQGLMLISGEASQTGCPVQIVQCLFVGHSFL